MNLQELKAYQRGYQLGMLNERRKWRNRLLMLKGSPNFMSLAEAGFLKTSNRKGVFSLISDFIRSGLSI